MTRSTISAVALGALVAGALSVGTAQAQTMQPQGMQSQGMPHTMQPQSMQPQGMDGTMLGAPQGTTGTMGTSSGMPVAAPTRTSSTVGPIGSGALAGVGPPTDGLDSNPYAEAPPQVRKALGLDGRAHQSASAPRNAKPKSGNTLN